VPILSPRKSRSLDALSFNDLGLRLGAGQAANWTVDNNGRLTTRLIREAVP